MPLLRFVVLKGVQGWGDRLQCLLHAIWYASATGRHLVIDWRDNDWCHEPIPLSQYFTITGVPTLDLESFLYYWEAHGHDLTVAPSSWSEKVADPGYSQWIYEPAYSHPSNNALIGEICAGNAEDLEADVVILPGVGHRSFRYNDIGCIQLAPQIQERVISYATQQGLGAFEYDVVHLRGGSKEWAGGSVPLKDLNETIHKQWPDLQRYLQVLWERYQKVVEPLEERPLYVITDRQQLADAWWMYYDWGTLVPSAAGELIRESGTHRLRPEDLEATTLCKADLNIELLRDFSLMLSARTITGDGVSLFSEMARMGKACGVLWAVF